MKLFNYSQIVLALLIPIEASRAVPPTAATLSPVERALRTAESLEGVPKGLLSALCYVESRHNPKAINKNDGNSPSYGLCQIKLATAQWLGFKGTSKDLISNPHINARYAAMYLRTQKFRFNTTWEGAVNAYNCGRLFPNYKEFKYVKKVMLRYHSRKERLR